MDKKRLKIALSVLDAVRSTFPETNEFIDSTLKEECEKEKMTADEVIFYKFESKKLAQIDIFCFRFSTKVLIFCLQMWKGSTDNKKAKRLSKEEIKNKLLDSMTIGKVLECEDLNKQAEQVQDSEKAAEIIKQYEDIIKIKNKGIINVAYHQEQVFNRFKENEKFTKLVGKLGIHKTTIIFKINVFKLCKRYPKLLKSSIGLGFS